MPKFLLIDHSLRDLGGHHYPYAYNVLAAAQRAGWQPVLVTHRRFSEQSALPPEWRVHALYGEKSYSRYTLDTQAQLTPPTAEAAGSSWRPLQSWWAAGVRKRHAIRFARDCARLFELEPLSRGDQVFFATTSELDLAGLSAFLAQSTGGLDCHWHLQFHFGVYRGREPDYAAQGDAAAAMRESFVHSLRQVGRRSLHFYCTTEQLTVQYQGLGVARFTTLPYPVHELFRPRMISRSPTAPLRVACLGHSRREKGYGQLPRILRALWGDWFAPGRAQLVLQTRHRASRRALEHLIASLPADGPNSRGALDFAGFPLPLAGYALLLCSADVGLMLYDPTRYYARCSGVLLEMLCAGVPVLVPAGGWLADQIEPENQRYLDEIALRAARSVPCPESGVIEVGDGQQSLLISCQWRVEAGAGEFLRLEFSLEDSSGAGQGLAVAIVGPRAPDAPVRTLLRLPAGCARVRLSLHNAWQRDVPPAAQPEFALLPEALPMGALGLTIAASTEVPRLLRDVLEHCAHYRARVAAHAKSCAEAHSGTAVLAGLGARVAPSIAEPAATT
jgi:hypothetical protein